MKKAFFLLTAYTLSCFSADQTKTQELTLRYIDSIYGVLQTQWDDNRLGFYIADGENKPTKITKFNGFVSIAASVSLSSKETTEAVCAKMQKSGKLYYLSAYHQLCDISNETDRGFTFPMPQGELGDLGSRLFFVVDPATPYVPSAQ